MREISNEESLSCIAAECPKIRNGEPLYGMVCLGRYAECPKIKRVDIDFSGMTSVQIRVRMAEYGWMSEDKVTDIGWGRQIGYDLWFVRWNWHDVRLGNKVSISGHSADFSCVHDLVVQTAQRALDAWQTFPDKIPTQRTDGWIEAQADYLQPPEFKEN